MKYITKSVLFPSLYLLWKFWQMEMNYPTIKTLCSKKLTTFFNCFNLQAYITLAFFDEILVPI